MIARGASLLVIAFSFLTASAAIVSAQDKAQDEVRDEAQEEDTQQERVQEAEEAPGETFSGWLKDLFPEALHKKFFLLRYDQWICLLTVIFLGFLADQLTRLVLDRLTVAWLKFRKAEVDSQIQKKLWRPVGLLVQSFVWYVGQNVLALPPPWQSVVVVAVKFLAAVAAVWTSFRLIDLLSSYLTKQAAKTETKFDDILIPMVSKTLKVFVACIGVLLLGEAFNMPLKGVLGGLGIGGLAFAFAAKESLGNLFGSLTVLVDRPFEIGDWIITDNIEGTVETVGIRSTRVRTFYNSLITLPNSLLTTAAVDNLGKRRYRRIKTMISLEYSTSPDIIEAFCEGVREIIRRHPYTRKDYYHVYLNQFSASSLDILLYCFVECPDWSTELRERHRLFIDIMKLADKLGAGFAFPTQTLHLFDEEHVKHEPLAGNPTQTGQKLGAHIAGELLSPDRRPGPVQITRPTALDDQADSLADEHNGGNST